VKKPEQSPQPRSRIRRSLNITLVIVLLIPAVLFIAQNVTTVEIHFMGWSVLLPLALVMMIALGVGTVIGWSLSRLLRYRKHRRLKHQ
jgi:uncharacterized integral membrane protein